MLTPTYQIPALPPPAEIETIAVLRFAALANRHLAELKGRAAIIPNPGILINTLSLQEARSSSEIENIVTTQDEIFSASVIPENSVRGASKEVVLYCEALHLGLKEMRTRELLLTNNTIIAMFRLLKGNHGGFRQTPGTALRDEASGRIDYVPPQDALVIADSMSALESFINDSAKSDLDPLIKMAIIHHQFESIHPFPDGNGRIGRIINILYLVHEGLLDIPILYLSRFINANRTEYYRLLQVVRDTNDWQSWIIYMLRGIALTAADTVSLVDEIHALMQRFKTEMRAMPGKVYSQDLLNNLFRHPYTRIEFVQRDLNISRPTATKYLDTVAEAGLLEKVSAGRNSYYINVALVALLSDRPALLKRSLA